MRAIILLLAMLSILSKIDVKGQNLIYAKDIPTEKLSIIPETTQGGTVSELLTDLEYIPLKGTKNQLLSEVVEMNCNADRIGILNSKGEFYLYDIRGNLLKIINSVIGQKEEKETSEQAVTYEVKQGDTLTEIAKKFNTTVKYILTKNSLKTSSLSIGQILHL